MADIDATGHVVRGTLVKSKGLFIDLLERWVRAGSVATIGDVGSYGGSPCIRLELNGQIIVLNADTKRPAVEEFLRESALRGAEFPWYVVPNQRGISNKVVYRRGDAETPGWYMYIRTPVPSGTVL